MRRLVLLAALVAAVACLGTAAPSAALASSRGSDAPWVDPFGSVGSAAAVPTGYWVDVDNSGTTTSGALGGSGYLAATGTGNVNYGFAQECAPTANGGPFSSGHYPPQTCAELGRSYSSSGPPGFWFTGNEHCVSAGRPYSGSVFIWHVQLPQSGPWHVEAHIPSWTMYGQGNHYIVSSDEGRSESVLSQEASHGQWVTLGGGAHNFTAGQEYTVELTQADTENGFCKYQMADQMKWVYDGSSTTPPVNTTLPVNTSPPTILGLAEQGQTLIAIQGTWTNEPTSYRYQWERCDSSGGSCSPISGGTSQSYTLVAEDVGHTIVFEETASNGGGAGTTAISTATLPVIPPFTLPGVPPVTGLPTACPSANATAAGRRGRAMPLAIGHTARGRSAKRKGHKRQSARHAKPDVVYASGPDEIAVAPGKSLTSAYYHFEVTAAQPFPRTAPQVHLAPIVIDSHSRRIFLRFPSPDGCAVVLTGSFPATPIVLSAHDKSFRLALSVHLANLVTNKPAGTFTFHLSHRSIARRSAFKAASSGGGGGSSGGLSFSLSSALDVYAGVLGAAGDSGTIAKATATLPAVEQGSGDHPSNGSEQPIGSTYTGSTTDNLPITIELTDEKTGIKHVDWSNPNFPCSRPIIFSTAEDNKVDAFGPIEADGTFTAYGEETAYYQGTKNVAGYASFVLNGHLLPAHTVSGVTVQQVAGTLSDVETGTEGIAIGAVCSYVTGFSASVAVTSG
jgi:hypothetical protein